MNRKVLLVLSMLVLLTAVALMAANSDRSGSSWMDNGRLDLSKVSATYTVTSTADDGSPGTLRWAINMANVNPGHDIINFALPGPTFTIFPVAQLPALIDPTGVTINGLSQAGASAGTTPPSTATLVVEIDGANTGLVHGIWVRSSFNNIIGLVVNNFEANGIFIEGDPEANFNYVHCCFVGTNVAGTADKGNGRAMPTLWSGVKIENNPGGTANENTVDRCLVSGNWAEGIAIWGPEVPGDVAFNHITGNYVGTDISGSYAIANDHEGVNLCEGTHHNDVADNLISGNDWDGVSLQGFDNVQYQAPPIYTYANIIVNNIIGLNVSGSPLGNGYHGVAIGEYGPPRMTPSQWGFANENTVSHNTIASNGGDGVAVWEHPLNNINADNNVITQNSIFDNNELGIDLQNNGVTSNDVADPDTGPNQELNFPVITSAVYAGGQTTVTGNIDIGTPPELATVEVFVAAADASGYGEGRTYVGSVTPDPLGNWNLVSAAIVAGDLVTSTTTDPSNNTSEFGALVQVQQPGIVWDCYDNPPDGKVGGGEEIEPNNVCAEANAAKCETAYCGVIDPSGVDADWWMITLPDDTCYCLHVRVFGDDTPNQYAQGQGLDPMLQIYADDCSTLLFANYDHMGTFPDAEGHDAQYDCLDQGNCFAKGSTIYMKISPEYQTGGPYLLIINCEVCECPEEPEIDTCEYYKAPYDDYSPNGMPDFDQKQDNWIGQTGGWSHCGPVALANCLWWFDSKFETCTTPPPTICDNYPLVSPFTVGIDDHDQNNVMPFVDSLALYCLTNMAGNGTLVTNLASGAQMWLTKTGLAANYTVTLVPIDPVQGFEFIREQVLVSQDVILLLGFYEEVLPGYCERIGGHYVTVAGVCTDPTVTSLCISDPYLDANEGEPPAGSAHVSSVHNDAQYVSGPHGTIHHDRYDVVQTACTPQQGLYFPLELSGYPIDPVSVLTFYNQNGYDPAVPSMPPQGGMIHTIIEWAVVICPIVQDTCSQQMPGDADGSGIIDISDFNYLVNFIYAGGPAPAPLANGDANGDCRINIGDTKCLSEYLAGDPSCLVDCTCVAPDVTMCCYAMRGNVDYDPLDSMDIADLVYMVDYMFGSGPAPLCREEANVDGVGTYPFELDIADLVYMVDYMFNSGPAPVACP